MSDPVTRISVDELERTEGDLAVAREVATERGDEIQGLTAAHELMTRQFDVMRIEKEHGWREADRFESELERLRAAYATVCDYAEQVDQLRAQRQSVLDLCDRIETGSGFGGRSISTRSVRAALGSAGGDIDGK